MPRMIAWKRVIGFLGLLGLWSLVFGLCLSVIFKRVVYKDPKPKAKDRFYSLNEFLAAIQSYIKFGMIIPRRTILASCQGKAYDFLRLSIAPTISCTASWSSIKKGMSAWRPSVK